MYGTYMVFVLRTINLGVHRMGRFTLFVVDSWLLVADSWHGGYYLCDLQFWRGV
jgi:hypothetical protein